MTDLETRLDRAMRADHCCNLCGRRRNTTEGYECARCRKAWGIQFTQEMVEMILARKKTVTRRVAVAKWCSRRPGDILWVRRTRLQCRIDTPTHLVVVSARAERLHSITDAEILKEGLACYACRIRHGAHLPELGLCWTCRPRFIETWDRIHGADAWNNNPEVARIEFKKVEV